MRQREYRLGELHGAPLMAVLRRCERVEPGGHLIWRGSLHIGVPVVQRSKEAMVYPRRVLYELFYAPPGANSVVAVCERLLCVNPRHLQCGPMSKREGTRRLVVAKRFAARYRKHGPGEFLVGDQLFHVGPHAWAGLAVCAEDGTRDVVETPSAAGTWIARYLGVRGAG